MSIYGGAVTDIAGDVANNHKLLKELDIDCPCSDKDIEIGDKKSKIEYKIFAAWVTRDLNLFIDGLLDEYMESDTFLDTANGQHVVRHCFGEYYEEPLTFSSLKERDDFQEKCDSLLNRLF